MPLYEYRCSQCKKTGEYLLKFSSPHPETCDLCGATGSLQKQMSQSAFQLKGTGWYVTDFKNPQKPSSPKGEESAPEGKEAGKDEVTASEPKAAATTTESTASATAKPASE
jgi:putative FmdB family regulatory protein